MVQLTLTVSMIGLAIGQLFIGPLSDRYGRKTPVIVSLVLFILSTVGCLGSTTIGQFLVFRFIQGVAGAGDIVISKSIATDLYEGKKPMKGMLQLFPDHPLLHGLSLLLEDGIQQGFRAAWSFTKMKIQECIHILVALDERMYYWFSMHNRLQKIELNTFMEKIFRYNLPLKQLAEAAGRSLSTFRRDFMQEFGTTPSRWLIARWQEEARKLILSGKRPGEILVELGLLSILSLPSLR